MSLLLTGALLLGTGGFLAASNWLRRRSYASAPRSKDVEGSKDAEGSKDERSPDEKTALSEKESVRDRKEAPLEGFVCQLGDVLMRPTGEEAWLAGAVVLSEEIDVCAVFVAPDAGHDCAIYVRPAPRATLWWLAPLDPSVVLVGGEPSSTVEHGGARYERMRRLPLRSRRAGVGAPDVGDALSLAEYASAGAERLLVLKGSSGKVFAYAGLELEPHAYEVIASGASTL